MDSTDISEQLFEAIDAIIKQRLSKLDFDKTITGTITDNSNKNFGKYQVTTDSNIIFTAYSEITVYEVGEKVYIRIPENDYTKQKVITGRYISDNRTTSIPELSSPKIQELENKINQLL